MDTYRIKKDFILTVGSIERRKNHEFLYDIWVHAWGEKREIPQLVICGYPGWKMGDFLRRYKADERVKDKIILRSFSDEELSILYRECLFTVLPSLYEGWSLTLPESLHYGKFCIASAIDPLQEIGGDFIDYANPYDLMEWEKKILLYSNNKNLLKEKTENIVQNWHSMTWMDSAKELKKILKSISMQG